MMVGSYCLMILQNACMPLPARRIQRKTIPQMKRFVLLSNTITTTFSVLWRCWLGSRKGIRPVKTEWWGAGVVICLELCTDLHMSQLMPLPLTVSCFHNIQIGFTFLVLAHLGSPGQRVVGCVTVCVCECVFQDYSGWPIDFQRSLEHDFEFVIDCYVFYYAEAQMTFFCLYHFCNNVAVTTACLIVVNNNIAISSSSSSNISRPYGYVTLLVHLYKA